jgi:predicted RNA-binding protein
MCESNVYMIDRNGEEKLVLESVDKIIPTDDSIYLENIFYQTKTVKARIKEMALVEHRIILEEIG